MNAREYAQLDDAGREAFHQSCEAKIATKSYEAPPPSGRPKDFVSIAKGNLLKVNVQIVHDGGENNLHYHLNSESNWFVLKGRVRFYGVGDVLLAELGPHESIFLPGGSRYWFEKAGDEDLEILQMVAQHGEGDMRVNTDKHKDWMKDEFLQRYVEPVGSQAGA
jgi:mannose-6-phosphate isomerase-like protein (cupin superfamily)